MAYKPQRLALSEGGTNANLTASNGGILYSTASAAAILSGTATAGQMLQSGASTTPAWSTATYPATAGTSGNILRSDGTNFVSTTNTTAGASLVLISNQSASNSATIDFTNLSVATYRKYILLYRIVRPANDGAILKMQASNDNGSTWIVTNYQAGCTYADYNSATLANTNSAIDWVLSGPLDSGSSSNLCNGMVTFYQQGGNRAHISGNVSFFNNTSGVESFGFLGGLVQSTGIDALRILMDSGNITAGVFQLYGVLGA